MDENLLISFLGELKTEAEYTAQQVAFTVNSEGQTIYYVLTRAVGDNGVAKEMMRIVAPNATGTAYVATNMALLSMEVPTALAFIGPALGVAVGAGVLSQTEPFQNIGTKIGESLYAFVNDTGQIYFPEETIQAYAEALNQEGAFDQDFIEDSEYAQSLGIDDYVPLVGTIGGGKFNEHIDYGSWYTDQIVSAELMLVGKSGKSPILRFYSKNQFLHTFYRSLDGYSVTEYSTSHTFTYGGESYTYHYLILTPNNSIHSETDYYGPVTQTKNGMLFSNNPPSGPLGMCIIYYLNLQRGLQLQPDAVIPSSIPLNIPTTYPSWTPTKVYPDTGNEQTTYPISVPSTIPSTITTPQPEYQTPQPLLDPTADPRTTQISQLIGDLVLPTPTPISSPTPQPSPDPDPSPTVNPDPPLDPTQPVEPNPPSANTDPDPTTPTIVDPSLISAAGKLFTVYNPSSTGLNDLGAYLWSANIIDIVKSIWQNPMDGIISYFVLYATPEANRTSTIYLGALDSGVSSPVVTNQFIDIDCGEVQIKEKWNNIGDYPPYTSIKLFLPFVGFIDINPDDVMGRDDGGGFIKVTYRVDVYTGTCLAQVWVKRAADMANYQILYTYNGNCAQQIPLTGATYQGLMQTLVGASVGFASAGLTGALASAATQFVGHQQVQMQRSGNMSANAGVLGQRKPYLIISRNNVYYATNFAEYYGYPAHATVVLGNMSGYVRVRDIHLEVPATSEELDEIEALLKEGVWF